VAGVDGILEAQFTVPSDSDLNWWWIVGRATDPTAVFCEIFEGQRRRLMNGEIRFDQLCSQTLTVAGFPGGLIPAASLAETLPFTHVYQRGTTVTVRFRNTSAAPNVVAMAHAGQLLYDQPSPPGMAVKRPRALAALAQARGAMAGWR
jgi:hypothetical protein